MEGRGEEEGWVATGGFYLPCQEKGVRPLALDSKMDKFVTESKQEHELAKIFLILSKAMQTLSCV